MKVVGGRRVFSVDEVTARLAAMFEGLRSFWVEAEVQDLRPARSQMRFTLRGEGGLDASMNAIVYDRLPHKPADGALVQAYGRMEFWRPRSLVSMRVERLELVGEGLLRAQVHELRGRLQAEGLLDPARKRRPPALPRRIGLVTSAGGAARQDVLTNVWARLPEADVVAVGVPVQGDEAPRLIARALRHLDAAPAVDVIVLARGGGSLEDLMAFNSEVVCRAVAEAATPVVSAVGHERDVTLCDLVADVRVSTPTAAAAAVVPSREAVETHLSDAAQALGRSLLRARAGAEEAVAGRAGALARALRGRGELARDRAERLAPRLAPALRRAAVAAAARADRAEAMLAVLSPRRTVARGYAIVREAEGGRVVADAAGVGPGRELAIELRDGSLAATTTGTGRERRRPGRRAAQLRGGPAPPGRGRRTPRGGRGGAGGGGGALRAGPGLPGRVPGAAGGRSAADRGAHGRGPARRARRAARRGARATVLRSRDGPYAMPAGRMARRAVQRSRRAMSRSMRPRGTWQPALPTLA